MIEKEHDGITHNVTFITGNQVCLNQANAGSNTWFRQLWRQHNIQGVKSPNVRKLFWKDMETFIQQRRKLGDYIVLIMDANENIDDGEGLSTMANACNLVNIHGYFYQADSPTYARSGKKNRLRLRFTTDPRGGGENSMRNNGASQWYHFGSRWFVG
jgi:hypothetical protein